MDVQRFKTWIPQSIGGCMLDMAVPAIDFDRVTAQRDALQQLLNARDEEVDKLRTLLRSMTCSYREAITNGHDRIVFLGGECDSPERMLNDNPSYAKAWEALENQA